MNRAEPAEAIAHNPLSKRELFMVINAVLITAVVIGTCFRIFYPFYYNPLDSLYSDMERHYHNAFDVKGDDLEAVLNNAGFEVFLSTVLRITGHDRFLISCVMALLSAITPWCWYRWFREVTGNKTIALCGYVAMVFLPSWFKIFGYFMDSVILLPLTGAGLWLTWRAARKGTWQSCLLAAVVCGLAVCTKSVALPILLLPWLWVGYRLVRQINPLRATAIATGAFTVVLSFYMLGPLKVWSHTHAVVLLPDGIYNQRYFESCAHDIQVNNYYDKYVKDGVGTFIQCCIWGSSSVCYPPLYPFSNWMSSRQGRYVMDVDYRHGRDYCKPIKMRWQDRLRMTGENIIFFFFEYQWPEDNDWQDPFPRNLNTLVRFIWLPLTLSIAGWTAWTRKRDFLPWYFVAVTLIFMLQQSAVMEGRYKKVWEGLPIGAFLYLVARSKRYQAWLQPAGVSASDVSAPVAVPTIAVEQAPAAELPAPEPIVAESPAAAD
jgi:hypothetical protein